MVTSVKNYIMSNTSAELHSCNITHFHFWAFFLNLSLNIFHNLQFANLILLLKNSRELTKVKLKLITKLNDLITMND